MSGGGGELLTDGLRRVDGRLPADIRPLSARLAVYAHADGSAFVQMGGTRVLCAVYGPHECRHRSRQLDDRAHINCQYSMATFSTQMRKDRPRGDRKSIEFRAHLQKTFESVILTDQYPRSQIDIFCEIIEGDGGHLAACINAGALALATAGIALKDLVSACACALVPRPAGGASDGGGAQTVCLADVCHSEEGAGSGQALLTMACLPRTRQIVLAELEHRVHVDQLSSLLDDTQRVCCTQVHQCLVDALAAHVRQQRARTKAV